MLKGISMAALAMKNQVARNDMIANNLANTNTAGFKKDIAVFQQDNGAAEDSGSSIILAASFEQGPVTRTDRPLDVAIQGDGFFVVETDEGDRYTRAGSFAVNSEGVLTTVEGDIVASSSGSIQIPPGEIDISREGQVRVNGADAGRIRVVNFEDCSKLEKIGSSLWKAPDDLSPGDLAEEETELLSGFLESSNVEVITQMTEMISALKAYEISQKALKSEDQVLGKLIETVGRTG